MRVYISVDMEGIGDINHTDPTDPRDARYKTAVALMVGQTNVAIEGALAAGATDILVNDSHWSMHNLLPADLLPAARVLHGRKASSALAPGLVLGSRPGLWIPVGASASAAPAPCDGLHQRGSVTP